MSKAEERARDLGYRRDPLNRAEYTANDEWDAFIDGYHQGEEGFELTWEDIERIDDISIRLDGTEESKEMSNKEFYQEVLKRFKDFRERKQQ